MTLSVVLFQSALIVAIAVMYEWLLETMIGNTPPLWVLANAAPNVQHRSRCLILQQRILRYAMLPIRDTDSRRSGERCISHSKKIPL
jgi:hypothetical protein